MNGLTLREAEFWFDELADALKYKRDLEAARLALRRLDGFLDVIARDIAYLREVAP